MTDFFRVLQMQRWSAEEYADARKRQGGPDRNALLDYIKDSQKFGALYSRLVREAMGITDADYLIETCHHDITPKQTLRCMRCETEEGVEMRPSYTAYHWNGEGKNPNADVPLCPICFEEHREYWNEMWSYARGCY